MMCYNRKAVVLMHKQALLAGSTLSQRKPPAAALANLAPLARIGRAFVPMHTAHRCTELRKPPAFFDKKCFAKKAPYQPNHMGYSLFFDRTKRAIRHVCIPDRLICHQRNDQAQRSLHLIRKSGY